MYYGRNETLRLEGFTDADWAGAVLDGRTTSGYCTLLGGNLVTWRSKKTIGSIHIKCRIKIQINGIGNVRIIVAQDQPRRSKREVGRTYMVIL